MRKAIMYSLLLCVVFGCGTFSMDTKPAELGTPTVFCNVSRPPAPELMGGWKCIFGRYMEKGETESNSAEYWLVKYDDKYALYFHRVSRMGRKKYSGWRAWSINGNEIISDTVVRIFTQNGEVYFVWENEPPTKMTRIQSR
jgi:hypothetical protein